MSWNAEKYRGLRHEKDSQSLHHRKPVSLGGTNDERNLSELSTSRHRAWHTCFQNWTPERIAQEISRRYIDPDYKMVAVKKETV